MHWVKACRRLKQLGGNVERTINTWDKREALGGADTQLKGKKRWAVTNLLERSTDRFIEEALGTVVSSEDTPEAFMVETNVDGTVKT